MWLHALYSLVHDLVNYKKPQDKMSQVISWSLFLEEFKKKKKKNRRDFHQDVQQFSPFHDEICIENGHTVKGEQVVIHQSLYN